MKIKPRQLAEALTLLVRAKRPALVVSSPGLGKSNITSQVADSLNMQFTDVRAAQLDPVDLRGLPSLRDGRTVWNPPVFMPTSGKGLLFLDELTSAPPLVQAALYQLILDRRLGEYTLPDDWAIIAAGNLETDGAVVTKMSSALANRFVHLELEADVQDWCKWAVGANIHPAVIAFIRYRPDLLHQHDRKAKAYPTPRSWEFVSEISHQEPNKSIEHALISGSVGDSAAIEYTAYLRLYRELPNIDGILLNPKAGEVPTNPATLYAVSAALARMATVGNIGRVMQYLDRLPVEYSVMAIRDAVTRDATLAATNEFTRWSIEHSDVTL